MKRPTAVLLSRCTGRGAGFAGPGLRAGLSEQADQDARAVHAGGRNGHPGAHRRRQDVGGLGQQVVVENSPGANTLIASEAVARAAPDGYTLIMQTNNLASNPTLYGSKMTFDTLKDLVPVALVAGNPHVLVVHPSVPPRT